MAKSSPKEWSSSQSKDEKFHSQTSISRIFHGIRQHIRDTKARKKFLRNTKALTMQKSPLKQQAASVDATRSQPKSPVSISKGISAYSYICVPGYSVQFSVPGDNGTITNTSDDNFTMKNLEVDLNSIPLLAGFTGRFQWRVLKMGIEQASGYTDMNAMTGNVEGGAMISTPRCTPIITEDAIIICLFTTGLPSRDQCTIIIAPTANKTWMGDLALPRSAEAQKPFSRFVLPAPHDRGMNNMKSCDACLHTVQSEHICRMD